MKQRSVAGNHSCPLFDCTPWRAAFASRGRCDGLGQTPLGFFAFFRWEFSLTVLAAVLAIFGYSVNESVVVFDRVRENFRKLRGVGVPQIIDNAITRTLSRTIITHGCTQLAVLSMLFFGGEVLHYFALALTIGILFGIYSSALVASPIVMWLGVSREDMLVARKETPHDGRP